MTDKKTLYQYRIKQAEDATELLSAIKNFIKSDK